jgi:hypothetical protein
VRTDPDQPNGDQLAIRQRPLRTTSSVSDCGMSPE